MLKYSSDLVGSAFMVLEPGFQLAGHTSPCSSVNCVGGGRESEGGRGAQVSGGSQMLQKRDPNLVVLSARSSQVVECT